jgi:hypothetical protein
VTDLHVTASRIDESLTEVRKVLDDLGTQVRALVAVGFFGPQHLPEMARQLEGVAHRALTADAGVVAGAGIAWRTGDGPGRSGMLWWRADGGKVTQKVHVDNPASDSYYDFQHSEWYVRAVESDSLEIAGPFIDAWGTDDHALTPSVAVRADEGVLLGVAAADLHVSRIVDRLALVLRSAGGDLVLVNDEDRVVVSDDAILTPGLRLEPFLWERSSTIVDAVDVPVRGWRLVRVAPR